MKKELRKEGVEALLSKEISDYLVDKIPAMFDKFNNKRQSQLDDSCKLRKAIYNDTASPNSQWQHTFKLPEIYELAQTFKAHLWESVYSGVSSMFDVEAKTQAGQAFANIQKQALVKSFEEMEVRFELEKAIDELVETGDAILFVGWESRFKEYRRKNPCSFEQAFSVEKKKVFDGAKVKSIPCENFVFDVDRKDNWDACAKLYRSYQDIEDILDNKMYEITQEQTQKLCSFVDSGKSTSQEVKDEKLEVLEFWGDIRLKDGKVLKNYLITMLARHFVVRFEPNPYVINPFVVASLITDPATKRGISPLRPALVVNEVSSDIMNKQLDALALMCNPPYLAPKGAFNGLQEVSPGKIIEFESTLMPSAPQPLRFSDALKGWDFVSFFKSTIEETTGIFHNMIGKATVAPKTATEINYSVNGQNARLAMAVDTINSKLILPMVEKVADLLSNFEFSTVAFCVNKNGKTLMLEVNNEIRQAEYIYRYGDKMAAQERKFKAEKLVNMIGEFAKNSEVKPHINWMECFKYALEQHGVTNTAKFIK